MIEYIAALVGTVIHELIPSRNQEDLCRIVKIVRPDFVADDG